MFISSKQYISSTNMSDLKLIVVRDIEFFCGPQNFLLYSVCLEPCIHRLGYDAFPTVVVMSHSVHIEQNLRPWSIDQLNASHKLNHKTRPKLKVALIREENQPSAQDSTSSCGNMIGSSTLAKFALSSPEHDLANVISSVHSMIWQM